MPLRALMRTAELLSSFFTDDAHDLSPFSRYVTVRGSHAYVVPLIGIALMAILTPIPEDGRWCFSTFCPPVAIPVKILCTKAG